MDRLTVKSVNGKAGLRADVPYNQAFDRLAAYEDTGLTPVEILDHEEIFAAYRHVCGGRSPEEIQRATDLLDNDNTITLPCKVGDTVYFIKAAFSYLQKPKNGTVRQIVLTDVVTIRTHDDRVFHPSDVGKTVFLTIEGATNALREV